MGPLSSLLSSSPLDDEVQLDILDSEKNVGDLNEVNDVKVYYVVIKSYYQHSHHHDLAWYLYVEQSQRLV